MVTVYQAFASRVMLCVYCCSCFRIHHDHVNISLNFLFPILSFSLLPAIFGNHLLKLECVDNCKALHIGFYD